MSNWRKAGYTATVLLTLTILAILFPISFKSADNLAEAVPGEATESALNFSFVKDSNNNDRNTASVSLNVSNIAGSFATSTESQKASFKINTTNATGYTLSLKINDGGYSTLKNTADNTKTIASITTSSTSDNFPTNTWGILPSTYRSNNQTHDNAGSNPTYFPAINDNTTNIAVTMDVTSSANTTDNTYTVGMGLKADYTVPAGTYTNTTIIAQYVANPVNYTITYNKNTTDTVTNMPYPNSTPANTQSGSVSATSITLSNLVPEREGYDFKGWCLGTVTNTNNEDSCSGTVYNPDGDGTNLTFGIDKTTTNTAILKVMWKRGKLYMWNATLADCGETMYDNRDGTERAYTTASITAGGDTLCWMTTNLALGKSTTLALSSTTSNVSSTGYTLPASSIAGFSDDTVAYIYNSESTDCSTSTSNCYGYYSYIAVTAGTNPSTGDATYDICPKGWRLPTLDEYNELKSTYTSGTALSGQPWLGVYAGRIWGGNNGRTGEWGRYWTSTAYSGTNAYYLGFSSGGTSTGNVGKRFGASVRCVKSVPKITISFANSGISSVKVCKTSGNCSGENLIGTISTSGGSVYDVEYGSTYYLYPTLSSGYELDSWTKTSPTGTLSSTSASNPTFTMGDGNGAITIATASYPLKINFGTGIHGVVVKSGSLLGSYMGVVTATGGTVILTSANTKYYLIPLYESQYTFNSWAASGGTVTSDTSANGGYGYYYYTAKAGVTNTATISAKSLGTTSSTIMQNLAAASCTHAPSAVKDSRDNEVYYIQRLADGKCWMLENLRLGSTSTIALNTSNTNSNGNYTLPASGTTCFTNAADCDGSGDSTHTALTVAAINVESKTTTVTGHGPGRNYVGVYYNYCAASAGTICTASNSKNASYDICPAGWKMPADGNKNIVGSYSHLQETVFAKSASGGWDAASFRYVFSWLIPGYFSDGSAKGQSQGSNGGVFLSSTWCNTTAVYGLHVGGGPNISPQEISYSGTYTSRYAGFSVRCILK